MCVCVCVCVCMCVCVCVCVCFICLIYLLKCVQPCNFFFVLFKFIHIFVYKKL